MIMYYLLTWDTLWVKVLDGYVVKMFIHLT